jgi:hypothetical protein
MRVGPVVFAATFGGLVPGLAVVGCTAGTGTTSSGTSTSSSSSSGASGNSSSSSTGGGSSGIIMTSCNSPAGATTLCDVQNPLSPGHPTPGTEVTFPDPVTVTSSVFILSSANGVTTKAFFIVEGEGGPFRGALVKGTAMAVDELMLAPGSRLLLTARVEEFRGTGTGSETQLQLVGGNVLGTPGTIPAAAVAPAGVFTSDDAGEAYEGLLVRVENVTATRFDSGAVVEYGAFRLQDGPLVEDQFFRYPAGVGETFSSITGFVRYSFDGKYTLNPRDASDVVSSGNPRTAQNVTVVQVQDPANAATLPHCIAPAECDPIRLTNMVVVSAPRVSDRDAAGKATLFSVFVQDPTAVDANLEPLPYSGVKLVFGRTNIQSGYTFVVYGMQDFPDTRDNPTTWPMPGDIITVEGSIQEYFDMTQVGNINAITKVGTTADNPLPIAAVPVAKRFSDPTALAGLAGGRNGADMCVEPVTPGGESEKWESVLLKLENVTTTLACVPTATNFTQPPACVQPDFGYFQVTGGVEIGTGQGTFFADRCAVTTCTCDGADRVPNDRRLAGKVYTSITGVYEYSFSVFRVNPRSGLTDVVEGM